METVLFWLIWGIVSFWVLKTFYYSYDKDKLQKLRLTVFGLDFAVLVLFFLPWISTTQRGFTGWELILQGNLFVISLGILITASALANLTKDKSFLKVGALAHITASILFILTMIKLMPGTFILTMQSVAPIIVSILLLIGNVVVLLLWQQLQLKLKKK